MSLDEYRAQIDRCDAKIIELLNERARAAIEIGKVKQATNSVIYVPEREKAVFEKLQKANEGPLTADAIKAIYREVISCIRTLERPTTVAYLGPQYTFSELATKRVFGSTAELHPMATLNDVFTEVERNRLDYGVVPVESSMGGGVSDTLDRFLTSNLNIIGEVLLHITQYLLSQSPLEEITKVYSKDQSFYQCRTWLQANLPNAEMIHTSSTAEAARIAGSEKGAAAIAGQLAAEPYNLNIVGDRIEDAAHNYTRFFVMGDQKAQPTGKDKTSLMLTVRNRPGALSGLIVPFAEANIDLTRIESRPSRKKAWDYVFFMDLVGHADDENVAKALEAISEHCSEMKVLGSYPQGDVEQ